MRNIHRTDDHPAHRDPGTRDADSRTTGTTADDAFNPSLHDIYWRDAYSREPYYMDDYTYDDYAPAYRTGYESAGRYLGHNRRFDDLEHELRTNYERVKGSSRLTWENAKEAVRAAWHRVERVMSGDFDDDGRCQARSRS